MDNFGTFGCDPEEFIVEMKKSLTYRLSGKDMVVVSMLSDVQELVFLGQNEKARQMINLVKYIVSSEEV
jgi:hypothetical protein